MANVLLLRSPSQDSPDRYEDCFERAGYTASSIPVLETILTNRNELKRIIAAGPLEENFGGVIITSGRACEAWGDILLDLVRPTHSEDIVPVAWSSIPFYAVGKATAAALAEISRNHSSSGYAPIDIRGESSGNSENLAHFIIKDLEKGKRLFYLTGDKNRDTLPSILRSGGVELSSLQVYKTQGSSTFALDLSKVIDSESKKFSHWWIVFFAPSAAEFVEPVIRNRFDLLAIDSPPDRIASKPIPRIAAIGPTTATFLRDQLRLHVDASSLAPTPEAIVEAIALHDSSHSS